MFIKVLNEELDRLHLLKHPFYQAWSEGALSLKALKIYAKEYYHHVAAFPRYISQIHALCTSLPARQVLLGNLIEEEQGEDNHPELWLRFKEGIGVPRDVHQESSPEYAATKDLVEGYFELVETDYPTGLGALYAYERQTPEVSKSKIEGLKAHYQVQDERTLRFFTVHQEADEWHRAELMVLVRQLGEADQEKVWQGALKGARLLWSFLDQMRIVNDACQKRLEFLH